MLVHDRRHLLLDALQRSGSRSVAEMADELGVSTATVRRDLLELEDLGLLRRTRGGAFVDAPSRAAVHGAAGSEAHDDAKSRIAQAANAAIPERSTIMLLGGTTTAKLLPHLRSRALTVVTNGLEIAWGLRDAPDVSVVMVGGLLHRDQMTLIGPLTINAMATLHVDLMVAGAYGVHPEAGVTGSKVIQAGSHEEMLRHADRLLVLADSSKLGRRGSTVLASVSDVDHVITDSDADATVVDEIRRAGPSVDLA